MNATSTMRYAWGEPVEAARPKQSLLSSLTGVIATAGVLGGGFIFSAAGSAKPADPIRFLVGYDWLTRQATTLRSLGPNWDGFGAEPINHEQIARLVSLIKDRIPSQSQPGSLVPGADGSLQVEWHTAAASLGMLIEDDGIISTWLKPVDADTEVERFGLDALELLVAAARTYLI